MVTASAPGKCHLIGEHAVVFNEPAIIAAIGLRISVSAEMSKTISFFDKRFDQRFEWPVTDVQKTTEEGLKLWQDCADKKDFSKMFTFVKANRYENYKKLLVGICLQKLGVTEGVSLTVDGNVPPGSGVGSSSALAVATAKALSELFEKNLPVEQINGLAYDLEKIIHGTPSGGDNSACCYGGLIEFRKTPDGPKITPLEGMPKLEGFVLVYTGAPNKTTGELVQQVRNLPESFRDPLVKEIGKMETEMKAALKNKDTEKMKTLINKTQENLAKLTVSTETIDKIAAEVRQAGGAAKLCGAGGGGVMLCWHPDTVKLTALIQSLGFEPLQADLAVEGVHLE